MDAMVRNMPWNPRTGTIAPAINGPSGSQRVLGVRSYFLNFIHARHAVINLYQSPAYTDTVVKQRWVTNSCRWLPVSHNIAFIANIPGTAGISLRDCYSRSRALGS